MNSLSSKCHLSTEQSSLWHPFPASRTQRSVNCWIYTESRLPEPKDSLWSICVTNCYPVLPVHSSSFSLSNSLWNESLFTPQVSAAVHANEQHWIHAVCETIVMVFSSFHPGESFHWALPIAGQCHLSTWEGSCHPEPRNNHAER